MAKRRVPAAAFLAVLVLANPFLAPVAVASSPFTHGVASGEVTPFSAVLWTRVDREAALTVEVSTDPTFSGRTVIERGTATIINDFTVKVTARPLEPGRQYFYRWRLGASLSEVGAFKTAPLPSAHADLHFAWTGDSDSSRLPDGLPAFNNWETLDAARLEGLDFFVYLGDTIYSDFRAGGFLPDATTLPQYRDLYKAGRDFAALRQLAAATSMYTMWDDHEVRNDWDGETVDPTFLEIGRKAFFEYMPLTDKHLLHDPDCATDPLFRVFRWGKTADLIIPDTRSCRSASVEAICLGDLAPTMPAAVRSAFPAFFPFPVSQACLDAINDPSRTILGKLQKERFKAALVNSRAKFKIVMTPLNIQQFWLLPYDNWEGYGAERAEILEFIRAHGIKNVVFLTTDGHQNVMKEVFIDWLSDRETIAYEVMTGPIATVTWQKLILAVGGPAGVAAQQGLHALLGADCRHLDAYSYGLVQVNAAAGTLTITLKDSAGNLLHDQVTPAIPCTRTLGP